MNTPLLRQRVVSAMGYTLAALTAPVLPNIAVAASTADDSKTISEVVVTAQRRSQSAMDVPVSISAYDNVRLEEVGARSVQDIARMTPGLTLTPAFLGTTNISIRGIASSVGTATTGIYIDDTPIQVRGLGAGQNATNAYPRIFDLERIEVLRGPQGTLFGAGSEGGTVRFITPSPSLTQYSAYTRGEFGATQSGDPSYELGAAVGGPIKQDRLGFRLSVYGRQEGGWIDRVPYPDDTVADRNSNGQDAWVVNATLAWAATDKITITPSLFYQREYRDDVTQYWENLSDPRRGRFVSGMLLPQPSTDELYLPSLRIQWDLGAVTLYSNTSYLDRTRDADGDYSFITTELLSGNYTGPHELGPTNFYNPQQAFTQELRLQSSNPNSRFEWVVGAFYQDLKQKAGQYVRMPTLGNLTQALFGLTVVETFGSDLLPGGLVYFGADTSRDKQLAGFGQVDYKVTDALTLTGGVRVAKADFSYTNEQGGPYNGGPTGSAGSGSETPISPKFGINYKATENLLLYASAAKGFRTGGANTPVPQQACAADLAKLGLSAPPPQYDSDYVWSYEIGSKASLLDNHVQIEASAFYIDWTNIQSLINLLQCGFQITANRGSAVSQGVDLQMSASPAPGLVLSGAIGYTDAKFTKTLPALVTKGDLLPIAPWHLSFSVDYTFPAFSNGSRGYLFAAYDYNNAYDQVKPGGIGWDPYASHAPAYRYASLRAGLRHDSWDVSLFVNNLFDYRDGLWRMRDSDMTDLVHAVGLRPRTIGVTATYRY